MERAFFVFPFCYILLATIIFLPVIAIPKEKIPVFTEPLAPVHYMEDGTIKGIATDVVREIFKEAGLHPEFEIYPWKRAYQKALSTEGSLIFTINRSEKREPLFKWIGPILSKKTYLYKRSNRADIEITGYEDAKRFTTAVILGHSLTTRLMDKGFREGKELITTPNKDIQIKVFLKGRADLITGNQYTIFQSLRSEGYSMSEVEPVLLVSAKGYFLGANIKTADDIIEKLTAANKKVQESGIVEQIIERYIR